MKSAGTIEKNQVLLKNFKEKKMKQKTNKKVAWVLAAALCASIALPAATLLAFRGEEAAKSPFQGVYGGSFTAFAAEVELPKVSLSAASADESDAAEEPAATYSMVTKGMFSVNNDFLLFIRHIDRKNIPLDN